MRRWSLRRSLRWHIVRWCTKLLTKPLGSYVQRVPNNIEKLEKTLRKGDVLLVEGDQRVSQVIRYLTQSSWSHSTLYVGDELLRRDPALAARTTERFGEEARHLLVEAVVGEGVIAAPLAKYESFNIRICRPIGLHRDDVEKVLGFAISQLGNGYDVRHIYDLARYFFPVSILPQRWRRAALHMGSGSEREVICSSMIANAFHLVGYPITPQVTIESGGDWASHSWWHRLLGRNGHRPVARFRKQDPSLITPRDFDLSPYFEVMKFNHLADPHFSYRDIVWDTEGEAVLFSPPAGDETADPELAGTRASGA